MYTELHVVQTTTMTSYLVKCAVLVVVELIKLEFAQTLIMVKEIKQEIIVAGTLLIQGHAEILTLNNLKPEKCVVDAEVAVLTNQMELLIALVMAVDGTKIVRDLVAIMTLNPLKQMKCAVNARVVIKP
jgi:hypothetical protein